jgi:hypothetical protein
MKNSIRTYPRRVFPWQINFILMPTVMLFLVLTAQAQNRDMQTRTPPAVVGGPGGSEFEARCPDGKLLGGFELRAGDDIDAIRPLCRTPMFNVEKVEVDDHRDINGNLIPHHYEERTSYGVTGDATAMTDWHGGPGGEVKFLVCPSSVPIVSAIYIEAEGIHTITINRISLLCEAITGGAPTQFRNDDRLFDPHYAGSYDDVIKTFDAPKNGGNTLNGTSICPVSLDSRGTLAVGIHGRSGVWLDALGLICDYPKLPARPMVLGRVKSSTPDDQSKSICERAQDARARNSPAAPNLEAQCRASREKLPPVALVKVPRATADTSRSICEVARDARARNSPAAPSLEGQCRSYLANKGAGIAETDTELSDARSVESDTKYKQGFDIATAIFGDPAKGAQGNTALGPGSLGIRGTLDAVGQRGFDASVKIHLSRKYQ